MSSVDSPDKHVIGNVVQMATILKPRSGCTDVIRRALSFDLQYKDYIKHFTAAAVEPTKNE